MTNWTPHPSPDYRGLFSSNDGTWLIEHRFTPTGREWRYLLPALPTPIAEEMFRKFYMDPIGFEGVLQRFRGAQERLTLRELGDRYHRYLKTKGRSTSRHEAITQIVDYLEEFIGDRPIQDFTLGDVELFGEAMERDEFAPSTRMIRIKDARALWNFAMREHWVSSNPFHSMEMPADTERVTAIPRVILQNEVIKLFPLVKDEVLRWYVQTLWITGCRPCEPYRIDMRALHVRKHDAELVVDGRASKTGKRRHVPIAGAEAVAVVGRFLATRSLLPDERGMRRRLEDEFQRLDMERTPLGGFRHSRITLWVEEGHNEILVSKWAGTSVEYLRANYYRHRVDQNARAWPSEAFK